MVRIAVDDLLRNAEKLLQEVEHGETLIVTRQDRPFAEIKPVAGETNALRPAGLSYGKFKVPDDFDAPLPDAVIREFEGQCGSCWTPTSSCG